jgi:uncharacterized protein (TIGR02996 family)
MTDTDFLNDILANPDAGGPRLRYADWLTQRGDPRGEFIHLQCELEDPADARHAEELRVRSGELLRRYGEGWVPAAPPRLLGHRFRRGFVEEVKIEAEEFLAHADALFASAPVRVLTLVSPGRLMRRIAALPVLVRLRALTLRGDAAITPAVKAIAYSPHLTLLTSLTLRDCGVGPATAWALASSPTLASLSRLDLGANSLRDEGVLPLASSPRLANLDTLLLDYNRIRDGGAFALSNSPHLTRLRVLNLDANPIGDEGRKALETSPHLQGLTDFRSGGVRGWEMPPPRGAPRHPPPAQPRIPLRMSLMAATATIGIGREPLYTLRHRETVRAVDLTREGTLGASACFDGTVRLWNARDGKRLRTARTRAVNAAVVFAPAGGLVAAGTSGGTLYGWDRATGKKWWRGHHGYLGGFYHLAVAPDSRTLAAATHTGAVALFSVETGELLKTFTGHNGRVWSVAYSSADNWLLASGGEDGVMLLRAPATGEILRRIECGPNHVAALAFSPDARLLAGAVVGSTYTGPDGPPVGDGDGVRFWNVETGTEVARIAMPAPHCLAFEPTGWRLATGGRNGQVHVWGVSTRNPLFSLTGHKDAVFGLTFSADATRLASCGADGRVCVWEIDGEIPF